MNSPTTFSKSYYQRYYEDPNTRVTDTKAIGTLAKFVHQSLKLADYPVQSVLDVGCGLGLWKPWVEKLFPKAEYHGVEYSSYLCKKYGWTQGSIVDFKPSQSYDLVICQGVLQYLKAAEAKKAIRNLKKWTHGFLYLEALTKRDWNDVCDQERTDGKVYLREGNWYKQELFGTKEHVKKSKNSEDLMSFGGGLFVSSKANISLFELEYGHFL